MRVVLPFELIGQKLVKGIDFPKSIADGSKNTIVAKVDGLPENVITKAYFRLSWENNTVYDLTFNGNEVVLDEYIVTLPYNANNKYVEYKVSMSIAVFDIDEQRLTTDPVEFTLNKSNYSDETSNTPDLPESQYETLLGDVISSIVSDDEFSANSSKPLQNKVITKTINEIVTTRTPPPASADNKGQFVRSSGRNWVGADGELLPVPSEDDEGKIPKVVGGVWSLEDGVVANDVVVDTKLDINSGNPVANSTVTVALTNTNNKVDNLTDGLVGDLTKFADVKNGYINADKGFSASTVWRSFVIPVDKIGMITYAKLWTSSALFYAVAFYSTENIKADSFIDGVTFDTPSGGHAVEYTDITIPDGAVIAVFCHRLELGECFIDGIVKSTAISERIDNVKAELETAIAGANADIESIKGDVSFIKDAVCKTLTLADATATRDCYIAANGAPTNSASWRSYLFNVDGIGVVDVSASVYSNSKTFNSISFYRENELSAEHFISGVNPTQTAGKIDFENVHVPDGTKLIVVSTRRASDTDETAEIKVYAMSELIARVGSVEDAVATIQNEIAADFATRVFGKGNIKAIYRDIPNSNDFAVIGDEIWFSQEYGDPRVCHIHRYKIVDGVLERIVYNMHTDFGHWNTVDYCAENDCLVFGNGGNIETDLDSTTGNFFSVVENPRALGMTATLADCSIKYPVGVGFGEKVQAVWGDANLGKHNIVYIYANNSKKIVKVMLKQNEDGSFYKNPGTGEGEYTVLETAEQTTDIGVGGGDFWGDTLYIGDGVGGGGSDADRGWYEMSMSDYSVKHIKKRFYRDDGTVISGSTQGIHVDSDYLWVYYNVSFDAQERTNESYLVQYYR